MLHSHSLNAVLASLIDEQSNEFSVTHLEMIKVGRYLAWQAELQRFRFLLFPWQISMGCCTGNEELTCGSSYLSAKSVTPLPRVAWCACMHH